MNLQISKGKIVINARHHANFEQAKLVAEKLASRIDSDIFTSCDDDEGYGEWYIVMGYNPAHYTTAEIKEEYAVIKTKLFENGSIGV